MATVTALLTAEEYAAQPDISEFPTELIKGNVVIMNPPMPRHGQICARVSYLLQRYLDDHGGGHVLINDSGIITERNPDTVRGADIAYYSYARVPKGPLARGLLKVAPELAIEVRSPDQRWSEIHAKAAEYLNAGVLAVCVLDDDTRQVHVFHADRGSEVFAADDELTLPSILAGFRVKVGRFFE